MDHQPRNKLQFVKEVQDSFRFLEEQYGYKCVWGDATFVKYELGNIFVNVYHGRSSFELGLEVGRINQADELENGYSLTEIFQLVEPKKKKRWYFAARTIASVKTGVNLMAEAFRGCATVVFSESFEAFDQLHEMRENWKQSFALEVIAKHTRSKAEMAFQKKEYAEAVRLYESIREVLTSIELKKLRYAKQRVVKGSSPLLTK